MNAQLFVGPYKTWKISGTHHIGMMIKYQTIVTIDGQQRGTTQCMKKNNDVK